MNNLILDTEGLLRLTAEDLIGQSVAILGIKGSGKSNSAAVIMEELLGSGVPICVVDVAGEYYTLKDLYPQINIVGRSLFCEVDVGLVTDNTRKAALAAYKNGVSTVLDLSGYDPALRTDVVFEWFAAIWQASAELKFPHVIFLEEAHNWVPQRSKTAVTHLFVNVAAEGRKRGLSLVLIGQRSARIDKDTLTQADIAILHRVRHEADMSVYQAMLPRPKMWVKERVHKLKNGEALSLVGEQVLRVKMRVRTTEHVGSTPTMDDIPVMPKQMSLLELLK